MSNIDAFNLFRKKWLGMTVLYTYTKEERKECGASYIPIKADVLKVHSYGLFDLHVLCPKGKNFTARNIPIKVNPEDTGVWEFTEQYNNDYRGIIK